MSHPTSSFFASVIKVSTIIEFIGWGLLLFGGKGNKDLAIYMIIAGIVGIVVSYILYARVVSDGHIDNKAAAQKAPHLDQQRRGQEKQQWQQKNAPATSEGTGGVGIGCLIGVGMVAVLFLWLILVPSNNTNTTQQITPYKQQKQPSGEFISKPLVFREPFTPPEPLGNNYKLHKFWFSLESPPSYVAASFTRGQDTSFMSISVSTEESCGSLSLLLELFSKDGFLANFESTFGMVTVDQQQLQTRYSSKIGEKQGSIYLSKVTLFPNVDKNTLIESMRRGDTITVDLPDLKITARFSLQGFTAAFNRAAQLCRSAFEQRR